MLTASPRRGFTLIELMLSVVLLSLVGGTICQLLLSSVRLSRVQSERIAIQSSLRGAALVVGSELRELSAVTGGNSSENDILSLGPSSISYRAMRGFGYTCQTLPPGSIRVARSVFTGHRDPQAGRDSALILAPGVLDPADSGWTAVGIAAVSTVASCPGAASSAITLSLTAAAAAIPAGTPVRIYEPMQLASYSSEGRTWLGMRSLGTGENIQPLFGPLAEAEGFRLYYENAAGFPATASAEVRSVTVVLRARGSPDLFGSVPAESLVTQIGLRNVSN